MIEQIGVDETILRICAHLQCNFGDSAETELHQAIVCEYIREKLCTGDSLDEGVSLNAIANSIRRQLSPFLSADPNIDIRKAFNNLRRLREVVPLKSGRYSLCPLRFVEVNERLVLVLGGGSSASLARFHGIQCKLVGRVRTAVRSLLPVSLATSSDHWQPFNWWLGRPMLSLDTWTSMVTERAIAQSTSGSESRDCDVYSPSIGRLRPLSQWMPLEGVGEYRGSALIRRPERKNSLFVASVRCSGNVVSIDKEAPLTANEALRLQFGYDARVGGKRQAQLTNSASFFELSMDDRLPTEEFRCLTAISEGFERSTETRRMSFRFQQECEPIILELLAYLGVSIQRTSSHAGAL
jgi:hypothetical protein